MRIAYLVSLYPAPSHTFIRREVDALRTRGLDIHTFSVRRTPEAQLSAQDRAEADRTFSVVPASPASLLAANLGALSRRPGRFLSTLRLALGHRVPGVRALLWAVFHFAEAMVLARELRRRRTDHLHNHFANAGATVGLLAAHFLRLPWSLTLHGISETDYPAGLLLGRKLAHARFAACVSWFGRAQAMRVTPAEQWRKFAIVRCGLDLAETDRARPVRAASRAVPRVICVGRLSPEKGQLGLLEAVAALRARGIGCELVLVGDGPAREEVERRIASLGLGDTVLMKGRMGEADTLAEIGGADLLVLPSFMEGLPIVLMEAMALGVPVVASRVAGVPELVEDGVGGALFRPADWGELADRMAALVRDPALRARYAAAARAKVEAEFDIAKAITPLPTLFAQAADAKDGPAEPPRLGQVAAIR